MLPPNKLSIAINQELSYSRAVTQGSFQSLLILVMVGRVSIGTLVAGANNIIGCTNVRHHTPTQCSSRNTILIATFYSESISI